MLRRFCQGGAPSLLLPGVFVRYVVVCAQHDVQRSLVLCIDMVDTATGRLETGGSRNYNSGRHTALRSLPEFV